MEDTQYIRKSIKFTMPDFGNMQEKHNPFNKSRKPQYINDRKR